ncbi:MAG TPA: cupin domain-containing protein [Bdellovibrionales bacterium]|nr:cupin domain-containing protein [Bdellovibrionales bacterium]
MKPGLGALLGAASIDGFLNRSWPNEPFSVHGLAFEPFRKFEILQSIEALLGSWPRVLQAHLPDVSDEASSVDVSPKDAQKLFANKMGLLFNNVETCIPDLREWIDAIRSDLGMPMMTYGRCIAYATPHGKGTAPHFDQNINFVLQLHGTKKWRIAPNRHVENPLVRHTMGLALDPELAPYAQPMPTAMPEDETSEIVLKPGSLLFVPRGYWHTTEAEGEALAMNFTFNQPSWADLFTAALRSRLTLSPEWRELADGVSSPDPALRTAATRRFDQLLLELTSDIPNWQASDILSATEGH